VEVKVALDVSAVPPRIAGAGRYIAELAARLPERDVDTTLITRRDDGDRWTQRSPRATLASIVPNARAARLTYEAWVLGTSHTARDVQLWHGPHYTMPRRGTTPTVVTIHDMTFFTNPEWHERTKVTFFRRAITFASQHARVLICVSAYSARVLEEILPAHAPIVVAPLGVDLEHFRPDGTDDVTMLRQHSLRTDVPYVFFVGTAEPRKGLDVLLEAFTELAREDGEIELWLAGQAGWGVGPFATQLDEHPYKERIHRLGFVDEALLPVLYRQARVVAYPSRGEGFGLPVLEAMACGALVVTTEGTVMAEIAGDGARLVPIGDSAALARALRHAARSGGAERSELARRARERAEHFTWDSCVDHHLVAYHQALAI
jgi:glycosyltransferase involved in cell wall biosynthesis